MKTARIIDDYWQTVGRVSPQDGDREKLSALSASGHLRCGDACCNARVTFRRSTGICDNAFDRHAYFMALEPHNPHCSNRQNRLTPEREEAFLRALGGDRPILIDLDFDLSWGGLRTKFNRPDVKESNAQQGLWLRSDWGPLVAGNRYATEIASDVVILLHFLSLAKAHGGAASLDKLWFANMDAVMSHDRFVAGKKKDAIHDMVKDFLDRTDDPYWMAQSTLIEPPHLVLLEIPENQILQARRETGRSILGQSVTVNLSNTDKVFNRKVRLGVALEKNLTNRSLLHAGQSVWVVGSSTMGKRSIAGILKDRARKDFLPQHQPDYVNIHVGSRRQFVMRDRDRTGVAALQAARQLAPA